MHNALRTCSAICRCMTIDNTSRRNTHKYFIDGTGKSSAIKDQHCGHCQVTTNKQTNKVITGHWRVQTSASVTGVTWSAFVWVQHNLCYIVFGYKSYPARRSPDYHCGSWTPGIACTWPASVTYNHITAGWCTSSCVHGGIGIALKACTGIALPQNLRCTHAHHTMTCTAVNS